MTSLALLHSRLTDARAVFEAKPTTAAESLARTSARIDRFAQTLPAFKAAAAVKGTLTVLEEALDRASGADTSDRFEVNMDVAEHALTRLEALLPALRSEVAKASLRDLTGAMEMAAEWAKERSE